MASSDQFNVWGVPQSTCTQLVLVVAKEREFPVNLIKIDMMKGEHKQAAHLARQPFGKIPAAEYKGHKVYESKAIAKWIDDIATGGHKLTPADANSRAASEQWQSVGSSYILPEITKIVMQRVFGPIFRGLKTDEAVVKAAHDASIEGLDILDKQLASNEFVAGAHFTFADAIFLPYFQVLTSTPEKSLIESRPHVKAWWQRISSRPSWQHVLSLGKQ